MITARQHLPVSLLLSVSLIQVVPVPIPSASLMHAEGPGTPQVLCLSNKVETTKCGCQAALYVELWGRVWWVHMGRGRMKRGTLQSNLGAVCATDPLCTHSELQCTLHLPTGQHLTMDPQYTLQQPTLECWYYSPITGRGNTNIGETRIRKAGFVLLPLLWQSSWVFCLYTKASVEASGIGCCTSNLGLLQVHLTS